jgi:Mg-chelatase subunit ChlD
LINTCESVVYEKATVAIAPLPASEPPLVQALSDRRPGGDTPMHPAVQGTLNQLRAHLAQNPGHKAVLVLATDGLPSCGGDAVAIADTLRTAQQDTPSIATYVIGESAEQIS